MGLVVPNVGEEAMFLKMLNQVLTLKLFSNNRTPAAANIAADYTEVAGSGYANKSLQFANWIIAPGSPSRATYDTSQSFNFTGATTAPGTIYGYFIVDSLGILILAERFATVDIPFIPKNGSLIKIKPIITLASVNND